MRNGLTLIELLLVVAIFLIIGSFSSPLYARFLTQNNAQNISDQITGQMRKAQIYAMMGKNNGPWGVIIDNGNLVLFQGTTYPGRNSALDEKFVLNPGISITNLSSAVIFAKITGIPNITPLITITALGTSKTVQVNSQGVVSKQ